MKTIDIHGKPYVMVKDRVIHFNKEYPNGCIQSKLIDRIDGTDYPNIVIFEATVIPNIENPDRYFTGHAEEVVGSSQLNQTSALENCETSAVGRALAMMGIGVVESIASAEEIANAVFQQNEQEATGTTQGVSQNGAKTPKNGLICPLCKKGVLDQRVEDIDGSLICPTSKKGKPLPAFKCVDNDDYENPACKFASWKLTEAEAGIVSDIVEDDDQEEAEQMAQDAEGVKV